MKSNNSGFWLLAVMVVGVILCGGLLMRDQQKAESSKSATSAPATQSSHEDCSKCSDVNCPSKTKKVDPATASPARLVAPKTPTTQASIRQMTREELSNS